MKPTTLALSLLLILGTNSSFAAPNLTAHGDYRMTANKTTNAYLEVDTQAFERNIAKLQGVLGKNTKICAILKADAYGNGIDLLMPSIIRLDVPCIGIASNEEARVARAHGYKGSISRVRAATLSEMTAGVDYDIEELVGNLSQAVALSELAHSKGKTARVHLALNSGGMDRNGLDLSTARGKSDALAITQLKSLDITGVMTHYAFEDEVFVRERLALFNKQSAWLIKEAKLNRKHLTLHTANSFATIAVPESHLDMVRPGGLIYGDTIDSPMGYEKIMSFKSAVASIQFYPKGTTVGYDGTYTLERDSYLANLPFGYSDGYRRAFTNKANVLINGHRVPVVGKVSMNTTMVDVTDFADIKAGDEVVIYGRQGNSEISQSEIEDINGALLADLYTVWGNSNPRVAK